MGGCGVWSVDCAVDDCVVITLLTRWQIGKKYCAGNLNMVYG